MRFKKEENGSYLTTYEKNHIPPLISVGNLLKASYKVMKESESDEELRILLAPGSSLGGARPKASVKDIDNHFYC